jgi:7,8-dihydroneopterin aldolase/epimerase/oxygenase
MTVLVEVHGLEVFGHHGVEEEERAAGQTFLFDLELEVSDAALSDRLERAVDYRAVAARVEEISATRQFRLLEALAAAVADDLVARFAVEAVHVRVRKPGVRQTGLPAEWTAATVRRPA